MLTELVPTCKPGMSGGKLSRAVLLQKGETNHDLSPLMEIVWCMYVALDYIQFLRSQSARHEQQLVKLKKEVKALRIMKE